MILKEKEIEAIQDLRSQEEMCIKKYQKYSQEAKDTVLKDLFTNLQQKEQQHYDSLGQVLSGEVPGCDCNDRSGAQYMPKSTYTGMDESEDKTADCYLTTDCIATEKLASSEYNTDVFVFGDTDVRKLLADIQVEEQNHAEMLYQYKTVNSMS
ncbi:MAG: ferritin-like domain-containing protein [Lachnospiraceae bacterium]